VGAATSEATRRDTACGFPLLRRPGIGLTTDTIDSVDIEKRIREFWNRDAETYDRSPSHALTDPVEAAAWRAVLRRHLPDAGARVLEAERGPAR
jgi:hypothetical protein